MKNLFTGKSLVVLIISLVSGGSLAGLAVSDYSQLTQPASSKTPENNFSPANSIDKAVTKTQLSEISLLFGSVENVPDKPVVESLPDTRLDLILKGTFTHSDTRQQSALISNKSSTQRYYIDDEIQPGTKINSIQPGVVTLRRNGQDEALRLPILTAGNENTANQQQFSRNNSTGQKNFTGQAQPLRETSDNSNTSTDTKDRLTSLKERLENFRASQQKD